MAVAWSLNVDGKVYGPYVAERMRAFAIEGRLVPQSMVTRDGSGNWRLASEDPDLAPLFPSSTTVKAIKSELRETNAPAPAGPSHFIIMAEFKSKGAAGLDEAILGLGTAYKLLPNAWIVSCEMSVNAVRNRLVQEIGKLDSLFVCDASHGKAAWFNFGPEADSRIRRVWSKTQEKTAA